jgi:hypothetical protein
MQSRYATISRHGRLEDFTALAVKLTPDERQF